MNLPRPEWARAMGRNHVRSAPGVEPELAPASATSIFRSRSNVVALVIFAVALVGLMVFGSKPYNVRVMQAWFLGVVSPIINSASNVARTVSAYRGGMKTINQLEAENNRLGVSNRELTATNQTLRALEAENKRLRKALGYQKQSDFLLIPARIVARDASTWYNQVIIDRGTADGIDIDMAVLTEEGLVGKTTKVSEHASEVVLISDENCRVAANVEGAREQGIAKGERTSSNVQPAISLNLLSKQANLEAGRKVITSGMGGVFPAGIPIGTIREFRVGELDSYATLTPTVDLTTLEDVFIVRSDKK